MMSGQQICLKWNSFQSNIVTSFESLWEEEGLVDVTLASDGQCLRAHKLILSACSPFFRKVFQSNPCQHPVIILQDVHFKELEALLSFVYKGEVNIDQENLPALLKAAETLQIRGLSGASEHVKEKLKSSPSDLDGSQDAPPLKRPRSSQSSHSPPIALTPPSRCPSTSSEPFESDCLPQIEPKLELHNSEPPSPESPLMAPEDSADSFQMAGTVQKGEPGYLHLPYACLLPRMQVLTAWAKARTLEQLACDLMKLLFSTEERILCNVNGKMGKRQFNVHKIRLIREVLHFYSNLPAAEFEEQWKNCVTKIDTANRGLKRNLVLRGRKATCVL